MLMPGESLSIPKAFWDDKDLSGTDILLMAVVAQLDTRFGCLASNEELMRACRCTEDELEKSLSSLMEKGYLYAEDYLCVDDEDEKPRILHAQKLAGMESYDAKNRDLTLVWLTGDVSDDLEYPAKDVASRLFVDLGTPICFLVVELNIPVSDVYKGLSDLQSKGLIKLRDALAEQKLVAVKSEWAFKVASMMSLVGEYSINDIFVWSAIASRNIFDDGAKYDAELISKVCHLGYDVAVESIKKLAWCGLLNITVESDGKRVIKAVLSNEGLSERANQVIKSANASK